MKTDILVIGSGIAGLSCALKSAEYGEVMILTKKTAIESNTNYAQGGIAAALREDDSLRLHLQDTVKAGCGLCDENAVRILVKNGPKVVRELVSLGVKFDLDDEGMLSLSREAGHSTNRIVHVGDRTGRIIEKVLVAAVRRKKAISLLEDYIVMDLIVENRRCYGAKVLDVKKQRILDIYSKVTALATGGAGQVYEKTSNPKVATGDGVALAYRAGADIQDMEFIQFHPTVFSKGGKAVFLISETMRGEGGVLRNAAGEAFMASYDERSDLASRDIASRAVSNELKNGPVYLDIRHKGERFLRERFPYIYRRCLRYGVDITKDLIPVVPAAHYLCGGVKTNVYGETSIERLFAFGECGCTGVHGANRLASNSLLESIVFSFNGIRKVKRYMKDKIEEVDTEPDRRMIIRRSGKAERLKKELQKLMWAQVGIMREVEKLKDALKKLHQLETETKKITKKAVSPDLIELENMLTVAKLITQAALSRKESIGTHYILQ